METSPATAAARPGGPTAAAAAALLAALSPGLSADRVARLAAGPERARAAGRGSANGRSRLIQASGNWVALTLARPWDREALPALSEGGLTADSSWEQIERFVADIDAETFVRRGRELDLPVALLGEEREIAAPWRLEPLGEDERRMPRRPRVVDMSSLWAGPLAARLLGETGCEVTKVESVTRPDGLRRGDPEHFELLNAGKQLLSLDFTADAGRRHLQELCDTADVVVISARRRAADALGLDLLAPPRGRARIVLAISGYGWLDERARYVAFGDDAAVAGGLVGRDDGGDPLFVGDAAADPLTGALGALAVTACARRGGAWFVDAPLARAAAFAAHA